MFSDNLSSLGLVNMTMINISELRFLLSDLSSFLAAATVCQRWSKYLGSKYLSSHFISRYELLPILLEDHPIDLRTCKIWLHIRLMYTHTGKSYYFTVTTVIMHCNGNVTSSATPPPCLYLRLLSGKKYGRSQFWIIDIEIAISRFSYHLI